MSTKGPQLGDTVEVTGLPAPAQVSITTEKNDARGLTFEVSGPDLGSYRPSFYPDKFKPADANEVRKNTRQKVAKWIVAYEDTCGIEGT